MKIATILKSNLALSTEQGEKIRDRILKKLYNGKRATVDCGGLSLMTVSFILPIAEIYLLYPTAYLKENLRFTNISLEHAARLNSCIENAKTHIDDDKESSL